jgi:hypothetical protein
MPRWCNYTPGQESASHESAAERDDVSRTYVKRLEAGVSLIYELGGSGEGYGGKRIEFVLRVVRHHDGSVTATCT